MQACEAESLCILYVWSYNDDEDNGPAEWADGNILIIFVFMLSLQLRSVEVIKLIYTHFIVKTS